MSQPQRNEAYYSYSDYLNWPQEERWEIIEGMPYMMTSPSRIHQEISMELAFQIRSFLSNKPCKVYAAPFSVRFPKGDERSDAEINTVVEPDIAVVCDGWKLDDHGCKGAPDLIIEITSPASIKNDMLRKFNLYEKFGVREYWIVEPNGKVVTVFTLGDNGKYGRPEVYSEDDEVLVSIFQDLKIVLRPVFAY